MSVAVDAEGDARSDDKVAAASVFDDPEEQRVLFAALDSFR